VRGMRGNMGRFDERHATGVSATHAANSSNRF